MSNIKSSLTERLGLKYFRRIASAHKGEFKNDGVLLLSDSKISNINRIVFNSIFNAAILGFISSLAAFLFLYNIKDEIIYLSDFFTRKNLVYLFQYLGLILAFSLVEMAILFFDIMNKSLRLVESVNQEMFSDDDPDENFARIICRAALELPNPRYSDINIDPLKHSKKYRRIFITFIIKAKSSITKLFFKYVIQRAIGKTLSRVYFAGLAIPVVAFWNAFEARKTINEVKIRVLGPSAVNDIVEIFKKKNISYKGRVQLLRAVTISIILVEDLHPNLILLYKQLVKSSDINIRNSSVDNIDIFIERFSEISKTERQYALNMLEYSIMLSGRFKYKQRKMLKKVSEICEITYNETKIKKMRKDFLKGSHLYS